MELIFQSRPEVFLGSNVFRNVPVIIQYHDTPMLEVGKYELAGYSTKFQVFHNDGTSIAVVKGSQIYKTAEGEKVGLVLRHEPNLTVCEMEGQAILELRREGPAALRGWAELYAPDGVLIKSSSPRLSALLQAGGDLRIGTSIVRGGVCEDVPIGIHVLNGQIEMSLKHVQYIGPADKAPPP